MGPITSYRQLTEYLQYQDVRKNRIWFIMILFNPNNQTPASLDIVKNIDYLNTRTKDVHFFMPGFENLDNIIIKCRHPSPAMSLLGVPWYFSQEGFVETIEWLEERNHFKYKEGTDLVLLQYYVDNVGWPRKGHFDLNNIIAYSLDEYKRNGGNVLQFLTACMNVVNDDMSRQDVLTMLDRMSASQNTGIIGQTLYRKEIKVFIAGSKMLLNERNAVRSRLMQISNRSQRHLLTAYTYEDFERTFTDDNLGRQGDYEKFLKDIADYAVFIIDERIGGITMQEFMIALDSFKATGHPRLLVYNRSLQTDNPFIRFFRHASPEIQEIRNLINENHQYFVDYTDIDSLSNNVEHDFSAYL